ncbi:hypothetical protein AGMMS50268_07440 [Spirochaetia bacterium]|nr:hypothetical protein AGMMS50268_07440 [Spirochaetia bacterium]
MNNVYPQVRLGDVCEYYTGRISAKLLDKKTYISTENMLSEKGGITVSSGLPTIAITPEYKKDNILLSNIRPYFKKIWFATQNGGCSNDVLVLKAKNNYFPKFLYYVLADDKFFDYSTATSKGTKMPRGDKAAIMQYSVPDIPYEEQRIISSTLSCLDDKIELNNRINANLEAQAKAIFKSWFVDFEPFQNGEFVESELGKIPKGWRVGTIVDCCDTIKNGGTPLREKALFWNNATIPWLTSGEVRKSIIIETEHFISELGLENSSAKWIQEGSTVIALYGATAGQVSFLAIPTTTNQAVCSIIPKENNTYFNYLTMLNRINQMENMAIGSAQQNISKGIVENIPVIIPQESVLKVFDTLCKSLFQISINNLIESRTLAAIRDILLPRLMSGEIEVPKEENQK